MSDLPLKQYYSRYGGYWRFPDMLDYCYLVNPYFNRSAIIKEMQDFFPVLVSEYPSGMGVTPVSHGKEHFVLGWTDGVSSSELKAKIAAKTGKA